MINTCEKKYISQAFDMVSPLRMFFGGTTGGDILNTAPPPPWAISGLMQVAVLSTISWFRAALSCSAQDCPLPPVSTPKTPIGGGGCQTTSERECECVGVEDPDWKPKAECSDRFFHPVRMDGMCGLYGMYGMYGMQGVEPRRLRDI